MFSCALQVCRCPFSQQTRQRCLRTYPSLTSATGPQKIWTGFPISRVGHTLGGSGDVGCTTPAYESRTGSSSAADPDTPIVGWEEEFAAIREYAAGVSFTDRQSQLTWRGRNHTSRDELRCAAMMPCFRDVALGRPAQIEAQDAVCVGCLSVGLAKVRWAL